MKCNRSIFGIVIPKNDLGFRSFFVERRHCNLVFDVSGKKFHAHSGIFSLRKVSKFINKYLRGNEAKFRNCAEDKWDENINAIKVADIEPNVFKVLLEFIYTDFLTLDVIDEAFVIQPCKKSQFPMLSYEMLAKVMDIADEFELPKLKETCELVILKEMDIKSVAKILAFADKHNAIFLKKFAMAFASKFLIAVMQTDGYKALEFDNPLLQIELLKTIPKLPEEDFDDDLWKLSN